MDDGLGHRSELLRAVVVEQVVLAGNDLKEDERCCLALITRGAGSIRVSEGGEMIKIPLGWHKNQEKSPRTLYFSR